MTSEGGGEVVVVVLDVDEVVTATAAVGCGNVEEFVT